MKKQKDFEALIWILFSDANARFNTLIEECAHLQDTIMGFVDEHDQINQIIVNTACGDPIPGFSRPVACDPKTDEHYYRSNVKDRAFLNLWNMLGGLILGLSENQKNHREHFHQACRARQSNPDGAVAIYWYISLRGYYLSTVFEHYTQQVGHAHENLIQMLENQAGSLPNPILLRRWSSAAYGEFLSEYSRHVNWESHICVARLQGQGIDEITSKPSHSIVTHTWTHHPTSNTTLFPQILNPTSARRSADEPLKPNRKGENAKLFASIQSAYFYLEQPILFPLLYHECIHINFPSDDKLKDPGDHRTFFGARLAAVESLRIAKFDPIPPYENFWDLYTEEIWNDAIAIALGGRGYLMSLTLQLIGLSGRKDFRHFDLERDVVHPLSELGTRQLRTHEIPYAEMRDDFLWESRLKLGCRLLKQLQLKSNKKHDQASISINSEACDAIEEVIQAWKMAGEAVYDAQGLSEMHKKHWKYRQEVNAWVEETIWQYLKGHVENLDSCRDICSTYSFTSPNTAQLIENAVNNYRHKYLADLAATSANLFRVESTQRLENLAFDVRWVLAKDLIPKLEEQSGSRSYWTENFASWMRHDGGAAFRMGLEWFRIRHSLMDALADIRTNSDELARTESGFAFDSKVMQALMRIPISGVLDDVSTITKVLRRRSITNSPPIRHRTPQEETVLNEIDRIAESMMGRLLGSCPAFDGSSSHEIKVGTITLGVLRPGEFASDGYSSAISKTVVKLQESAQKQKNLAETLTPYNSPLRESPSIESTVVPLVGEYQLMSLVSGSTPVERDFHPNAMPRLLLKPRLVLQAAGGEFSDRSVSGQDLYARVSMIRFKYRWQWTSVMEAIDAHLAQLPAERKIEHYSLYLSSAWEDAILITWHRSEEDLWDGLSELGLNANTTGISMQSSFIVPSPGESSSPDTPSQINGWLEDLQSWAKDSGLVARIYERSGRYDYTIVWKNKNAPHGSQLQACLEGLSEFPQHLWKRVSGLTSSFEKRLFSNSTHAKPPCKAVTHIAVND